MRIVASTIGARRANRGTESGEFRESPFGPQSPSIDRSRISNASPPSRSFNFKPDVFFVRAANFPHFKVRGNSSPVDPRLEMASATANASTRARISLPGGRLTNDLGLISGINKATSTSCEPVTVISTRSREIAAPIPC